MTYTVSSGMLNLAQSKTPGRLEASDEWIFGILKHNYTGHTDCLSTNLQCHCTDGNYSYVITDRYIQAAKTNTRNKNLHVTVKCKLMSKVSRLLSFKIIYLQTYNNY